MSLEVDYVTFLSMFSKMNSFQTLPFQLILLVSLSLFVFAFCFAPGGFAWALVRNQSGMVLPGPCGFPFLGQAFIFSGSNPHRLLEKLARKMKARNLMAFSIGFTRFIITGSPETAKEILNSSAFADRPVKESAFELLFHRAMGFAPFGVYWRKLRRISATHLFSPTRIASFEEYRREIGEKMVVQIENLMKEYGQVEVKKVLHLGSLNNVMMSVFGKKYEFQRGGEEAVQLEELVREGYELLGIFNWSDHFPVIEWFDFQGVRRRCRKLMKKVSVFVGRIIEEHKEKKLKKVENDVRDFVDILLNLEEEEGLSHSDTIAVLWEMIFRGTDTVAILLEWILARIVLHPDIQAKAQAEIDSVLGKKTQISESDISNLPYLQALVKETLRVHPTGPLLSWARLSIHDVHVQNYFIPSGTTAMVNMWAITHDEKIWTEPERFNPDRFLEEDLSIYGSDLRLAPFGSGRRVCPGKAWGLTTVHLWLAQLIQNFKWVPSENGVDLSESLKLSLEMKNPLVCMAVPRLS